MSSKTPPPCALIGFGQVYHARLQPTVNRFRYPTFFLMLPMRHLHDSGGALAINKPGAISFHDCDHGDGRSPEQGGALAWLNELLLTQGIDDANGEIWLHCYPRVLGYTFKPVSFWFCHHADGHLRAIVAEVNNTFGERHFYLLDQPRFGAWVDIQKVFHVSPFCDVKGQYHFCFMRSEHQDGLKTSVLIHYHEAEKPILKTSISGTLLPITPATLRRALWRYPAMTIMIMLRIHWQALKLWVKRTGFRHKPSPPDQPVTR